MVELSFTQTSHVSLVDYMGNDESIIKAAVVSTGLVTEDWSELRIVGLINRLMADRHGAPFEHVVYTFKVTTPLFTARQMMRHRIASFNEASGRYRVLPSVFYTLPDDRPVRQEGKTMDYNFVDDKELLDYAQGMIAEASQNAYLSYEDMLQAGVAKEVARMILPVNIMTEFFVTINLRSLFNLFSLRGKETGTFPSHPQYEITVVTEQIERLVQLTVPRAYEAFRKAGRVQP